MLFESSFLKVNGVKAFIVEWPLLPDAFGDQQHCPRIMNSTTVFHDSQSNSTTWNRRWWTFCLALTADSDLINGYWKKATLQVLKLQNCNWNRRNVNGASLPNSAASSINPFGSVACRKVLTVLRRSGSMPTLTGKREVSQSSMIWTLFDYGNLKLSSRISLFVARGFTTKNYWAFGFFFFPHHYSSPFFKRHEICS